MKPMKPMKRIRLSLVLTAAVTAVAAAAPAQSQPTADAAAGTNAPTHAQYALGLLKHAADKLSAAKSFTFKTTTSVEVLSPVGQMINYYSTAEVARAALDLRQVYPAPARVWAGAFNCNRQPRWRAWRRC